MTRSVASNMRGQHSECRHREPEVDGPQIASVASPRWQDEAEAQRREGSWKGQHGIRSARRDDLPARRRREHRLRPRRDSRSQARSASAAPLATARGVRAGAVGARGSRPLLHQRHARLPRTVRASPDGDELSPDPTCRARRREGGRHRDPADPRRAARPSRPMCSSRVTTPTSRPIWAHCSQRGTAGSASLLSPSSSPSSSESCRVSRSSTSRPTQKPSRSIYHASASSPWTSSTRWSSCNPRRDRRRLGGLVHQLGATSERGVGRRRHRVLPSAVAQCPMSWWPGVMRPLS